MPSFQLRHVRKLDDDDTLGLPVSFELFGSTSAHDETASVSFDCRKDLRSIFLVAVGVFDFDLGDHVCAHAETASAIALPTSSVPAVPPMSRVRGPFCRTRSIALTIDCAASACPRCSSIIAPDQICPIGFATPLPAIS